MTHGRIVLALATLAVVAALGPLAPAHPPRSVGCSCGTSRLVNGWCGEHGVGYVYGVPVRSWMLFEALDAHGHDVDIETLECAECRDVAPKDGFCEQSRCGFVRGQLYFTRLTWLHARGKALDVAKIECRACRRGAERSLALGPRPPATRPEKPARPETPSAPATPAKPAQPAGETGDATGHWCDACARGIVGNVVYTRRSDFGAARVEYRRLLRAIATTGRCEYCAVATLFDSRCPTCRIRYRDAKPIVAPPADGQDATPPSPPREP